MRNLFRALAVVSAVGFGIAGGGRCLAGTPAPGFADTLAVGGLSTPTAIAFLPDGRLLIAEKGGALKLQSGTTASTLVNIPVCTASEMGLLGVAVDPAFASNGFIYLYRTENAGGCGGGSRFNEVVRVTMGPGDTIGIGSLTVLLTGIATDGGNHDGGAVRIGPDGKLYVGVGDTGNGDNVGCSGTSTNPYSQDLGRLEGKVLRLNLDGTVPLDNPFVATVGARGEVFAYGFRNPFRMGFDPANGSLWVADVGDLAFEEIDIVTAGGNYGWPQCEATNHPSGCKLGGEVDPIYEYSHDGGCPGENTAPPSLGSSITGGAFAGSAFGAFAGSYVFGDYTGNTVYLAIVNGTRDDVVGNPTTLSSSAGNPVDLIAGTDGAVYYVAIGSGEIRRLAAAPNANDQLLLGSKLKLTSNVVPTKKSASFSTKDIALNLGAGNGSADDPVLNGGSVRLRTGDGCGGPCDTVYPLANHLPAEGWSYIGAAGQNKGYKYKSTLAKFRVTIRNGKLVKVGLKGALGHDLQADPQPVAARLTIGGHNYCVEFGGTTKFIANKVFTSKNASPPGACPD